MKDSTPGETKPLDPEALPVDVKIDFLWAGSHNDQIRSIVIRHLPEIMTRLENWREASLSEDTRQATDFVLGGLSIAARVRRAEYRYRDLTLRNRRPSGIKSERAKIAEGAGDIGFYGWTNQADEIEDYLIYDLHAMRQTGLIDSWRVEKVNKDGSSSFCIWYIGDLKDYGCVIASSFE